MKERSRSRAARPKKSAASKSAAPRKRRTTSSPAEPRFDGALVGVDVASAPRRVGARAFLMPLVIGLLAALVLASLRIDLLRGRYALAAAIEQEQALQSEKRVLTARMRELRDPALLAERAESLSEAITSNLLGLSPLRHLGGGTYTIPLCEPNAPPPPGAGIA